MRGWTVVRWTGALGLASVVAQLLALALFAAAGLPPGFDDATKVLDYVRGGHFVLTTSLILLFIAFALLLGFSAGLRAIAVAAAADQEWLATTTLAAGIATAGIGFAGLGLTLTSLAVAVSGHADASLVRGLFEASGVIGGAPTLVPLAFYLGAAGSLGATARILPRWLALEAWIGSALVFLACFSAYGGSDVTAFWSANGLVTILALLPFYLWMLGASVALLRAHAQAEV